MYFSLESYMRNFENIAQHNQTLSFSLNSRCDVGEIRPSSLTTEVANLCVYSCRRCPNSSPYTVATWGSLRDHHRHVHKAALDYNPVKHLKEAR